MLDFRHETFLALCNIGSYTKTAEALCVTQPAVSQHIKHLEERYGGKLFCYEGKKLRLTERGRRLHAFVLTVSADSAHLKEILPGLGEREQAVSFGATLSIGEYVMPGIMAALLAERPEAALHMQVSNTRALLQKLRDGEISFALLEGFFNKAEYDWELFSKEEYIAVCGPASPLAGRDVLLGEMLGQRLLIRESGSGTREIFEQILHEHNHTIESFRRVCVVGNMSAIKELVQKDLGITFLYKVVAERELRMGTLRQISIRDFTVWRAFHFVFLQNSAHRPEFLEWYRTMLAALTGHGAARRS